MQPIKCLFVVWTVAAAPLGSVLAQSDAAPTRPVGMIVQSEGQVLLQRSGSRMPAQLADLLYPKDRLTAVSGEASFLFCPSAARVPLAAGTSLEFAAQEYRVVQGDTPEAQSVRRCTLPEVALGSESMERIGAVRVRKSGLPEIARYLGGPVSTSRPHFTWEPQAGAESYRVTLLQEGGTVLWEEEVAHHALEYPAGRDALAPGVYEWRVEAFQNSRPVAQAVTRFEVKPGDSPAPSVPADTVQMLLAAVELENAGFYAEAARLYRGLRESSGDERLTRRLAWLYLQAGLNRAAEVEKEQLGG